ncbi:MAG: pyridoxal phosphate-dependent decarboxylase family protein [Candidatus Eiseniibacteriota bacterium]
MKPGLQQEMLKQLGSRELFDQAAAYAREYMGGVLERRVYPDEAALAGLAAFDEALPDQPESAGEILRQLHEHGSPATVTTTGGRYFGFVIGGALPAALAARWLADSWDQNPVLHVISPVTAKLEETCEKWLVDLLRLPEGTAASILSGTSSATLCGLAAGRYALLDHAGWDVNQQGLAGAPPLRVVVNAEAHASVFRALALLGFGRARLELVPADDQGRMRLDALPTLDARCLVIAQAGHVNSGAFDPLQEIGERTRKAGAWLHVDGAFGLWAAASRSKRVLARGVELADSWSADAHKTLNAPYDCGILLCRERRALIGALETSGSYLAFGEHRDGMLYTHEMSRRARAIDLWATLKALGRAGVEDLVDRLCSHAERFARGLKAAEFRVPNDVVFNQVLVACESPELTRATLAHLQAAGECWCGGATWAGEPVIRISVCSWATTEADVDRSVAAFVAARDAAREAAREGLKQSA